MKMKNKGKLIRNWGTQVDPQICAEDYQKAEYKSASKWVNDNFGHLDKLDRDTINLYRRHKTNCDYRSVDDITNSAEKVLLSQRSTCANDPAWGWVEDMYSKSYKDLYQIVGSSKLAYAIKSLTDKQTEVLYLTAIHQMPIEEIAQYKGTTRKNVRNLLARASANVIQFLKDYSGISTLKQTAILLALLAILIKYFL